MPRSTCPEALRGQPEPFAARLRRRDGWYTRTNTACNIHETDRFDEAPAGAVTPRQTKDRGEGSQHDYQGTERPIDAGRARHPDGEPPPPVLAPGRPHRRSRE